MAEKQQMQSQKAENFLSMQDEEETIDLVELMYKLLDKWKLILCLALIGALIAGTYTFFVATPIYQATSTIYVLSRKDSAINMSDLQIGTALTRDYIEVFNMWEVHEEVISNLNLPYSYREMREMLTINNPANTRMLDIVVESPSAEEAALIANEYAKVAAQYIVDTMATDKPNIMSVARVPVNPVRPNKTKDILIGFLLGMLISMGIVTVQFLMDDKFKTPEEIRKYTGMTNLALIPLERNRNDNPVRHTNRNRRSA